MAGGTTSAAQDAQGAGVDEEIRRVSQMTREARGWGSERWPS